MLLDSLKGGDFAVPVRIDRFEEVDASVFDEYPRPAGPGKKIDPR